MCKPYACSVKITGEKNHAYCLHVKLFILFFFIGQWFQLPDFPNYNKWGFSVISLNNNVYVTGELT